MRKSARQSRGARSWRHGPARLWAAIELIDARACRGRLQCFGCPGRPPARRNGPPAPPHAPPHRCGRQPSKRWAAAAPGSARPLGPAGRCAARNGPAGPNHGNSCHHRPNQGEYGWESQSNRSKLFNSGSRRLQRQSRPQILALVGPPPTHWFAAPGKHRRWECLRTNPPWIYCGRYPRRNGNVQSQIP